MASWTRWDTALGAARFRIALVSCNLFSVTRAALRTAFGAERVDEEVSSYYIASEARVVHEGLDVATDPQDWSRFQTMSAARLAEELVKLARAVQLPALRRHRRGAKKPMPKSTKHTDTPHVSTARLLTRARGTVTPRKGWADDPKRHAEMSMYELK